MESLRLRTDENTLSLWRKNYFIETQLNSIYYVRCMCLCACACLRMCVFLLVTVCSGQVTMERARPLPKISYFNPQQSVMSTKTQARINNTGRGGRNTWQEKK